MKLFGIELTEKNIEVRVVDYLPEDTMLLTAPLTPEEALATAHDEQARIDAYARKTVILHGIEKNPLPKE